MFSLCLKRLYLSRRVTGAGVIGCWFLFLEYTVKTPGAINSFEVHKSRPRSVVGTVHRFTPVTLRADGKGFRDQNCQESPTSGGSRYRGVLKTGTVGSWVSLPELTWTPSDRSITKIFVSTQANVDGLPCPYTALTLLHCGQLCLRGEIEQKGLLCLTLCGDFVRCNRDLDYLTLDPRSIFSMLLCRSSNSCLLIDLESKLQETVYLTYYGRER